jgi:succinate dehydrogenase / fumarate reductase flavoprotein subunit
MWSRYRSTTKLVSPANRKKFRVAVVGTGLAGSSLAASLGEMAIRLFALTFTIPLGAPIRSQHKGV